jgi:hypothetical protein
MEADPASWDYAFSKRVSLFPPGDPLVSAQDGGLHWQQDVVTQEAAILGRPAANPPGVSPHSPATSRSPECLIESTVKNYNGFVSLLERQ